MTMTASPEPGPGEGRAEWRLAFCLFPQGPLPGKLFSISHTWLTDCICAGVRDAGTPPCYHASL